MILPRYFMDVIWKVIVAHTDGCDLVALYAIVNINLAQMNGTAIHSRCIPLRSPMDIGRDPTMAFQLTNSKSFAGAPVWVNGPMMVLCWRKADLLLMTDEPLADCTSASGSADNSLNKWSCELLLVSGLSARAWGGEKRGRADSGWGGCSPQRHAIPVLVSGIVGAGMPWIAASLLTLALQDLGNQDVLGISDRLIRIRAGCCGRRSR